MLCQRPLAPDASDEIALDPRILSPVSSRFPVGLDAAKQDERHEMNGRSEGITKSHDDSQRREVVERNRTNAWFHESDHRGRASAGLSDACSNCESKAWMQCCLQSREREMSTNFSGAKGRRDSCCKNACSLSDEWDARRVHVKQANEEGCTHTRSRATERQRERLVSRPSIIHPPDSLGYSTSTRRTQRKQAIVSKQKFTFHQRLSSHD